MINVNHGGGSRLYPHPATAQAAAHLSSSTVAPKPFMVKVFVKGREIPFESSLLPYWNRGRRNVQAGVYV